MYTRQLKKLSRTRLDDVLLDEGVIDRAHVEDAQAESEMTGRPLAHILFERNEIDEWELAKMVARNYSMPFVDVVTYSTPREAEMLLDIEFCRRNLLVPFDVFGGIPAVAACEMPSGTVLKEIERRCGELPFVYVTLRGRLLEELESREAGGVAPRTSADMPELPASAPASDGAPAAQPAAEPSPTSPLEELESASMRLGFNMHMRGPGSPTPLPPALPRVSRPARPADTKDAELPPPFTSASSVDPLDSASQEAFAESGEAPGVASTANPAKPEKPEKSEKPGKAAAWQSIFDLGDEATLDG